MDDDDDGGDIRCAMHLEGVVNGKESQSVVANRAF